MIKFIEGENWCRWNDTLMSPEKQKELFGLEYELEQIAEDVWYYDGWIYSDRPFGETLKLFGTKPTPDVRDKYSLRPSTLLYTEEFFDDIHGIKPIEDFYIDYPDFNYEEYNKFSTELDEYYDNEEWKED